MVKITKEAALSYHETGRPGKIEVKPTKPYHTQTDLSLAYSPAWHSHVLRSSRTQTMHTSILTRVTWLLLSVMVQQCSDLAISVP